MNSLKDFTTIRIPVDTHSLLNAFMKSMETYKHVIIPDTVSQLQQLIQKYILSVKKVHYPKKERERLSMLLNSEMQFDDAKKIIEFISRMYDTCISIWNEDWIHITPQTVCKNQSDTTCMKQIYLLYSEPTHFDSLIKKDKTLSLNERFNYYKNIIDSFNPDNTYEQVRHTLRIANNEKQIKTRHRLGEHPEFFVDAADMAIDSFTFTKNQKFLQKFLSFDTNNRSILLFHGVGVGKTCSSILIAENFSNIFEKRTLIMLPSSLESNYRKELFDVSKVDFDNKMYDSCNGQRYLDRIVNWEKLTRTELHNRVNKMINDDYQFFGYLKIVNVVEKIKKKAKDKFGTDKEKIDSYIFWNIRDIFSNRVIVIDEIHNIRLSSDLSMKKFPKTLETILTFSYNIRLVLLSATPMFNEPEEISWIMRFVYLADKEYKDVDYNIEFNENEILTSSSIKNLKYFAKNYVSYMRGYNPDDFPVRYYYESILSHPKKDMLSEEVIDTDIITQSSFKFAMVAMQGHQEAVYNSVRDDKSDDMQNVIQISNITYPNEKYPKGKIGFLQQFDVQDTKLLKVKYRENTNRFLEYQNIKNYSAKIFSILQHIRESDGLIIVYSKYLYSGIVPLALALEHMGYHKYNNNNISDFATKKKGSYIVITAENALSPDNERELAVFNAKENSEGKNIKIALINEIAAEGVTFKNVRELHILEPWYNMSKIEQIVGRGVRFRSHVDLPASHRNVCVFLYINILQDNEKESIDYRRYRSSLTKQNKIDQVEQILKQNAIDCALNKFGAIDITKNIITSKGEELRVVLKYDAINCSAEASTLKTSNQETNQRLLYLDIIQTAKYIIRIIEKQKLYVVYLDMFEQFNKQLVPYALDYLCRNKNIITINSVSGFLIKKIDKYYFQQKEITDTKLNIWERQQNKRHYIKSFSVVEKSNKIINKSDIDEKIAKNITELRDVLQANVMLHEQILVDMAIDRLDANDFGEIHQIRKEEYVNSLIEGSYLIKSPRVFFNMYTNKFVSESGEEYGYAETSKYKQMLTDGIEIVDDKIKGFMEITKSKDKIQDIRTKIKHLEDPEKRTTGSACISTSTFKKQTLLDYIKLYDNKIEIKKQTKWTLCTLYEYVLRKSGVFARPVKYMLKKN